MAMNVQFLRGLAESYKNLATKDNKTFYFTTDDNRLYLGEVCLSNQPVEDRIKVIEDHGYVNGGEVDAKISAAIANYYTKGEIDTLISGLSVGSLETRIAEIEKDYLTSTDKTELEGKVTAHETAVNTKFENYSTTDEMNAAIDADVKVVTDYIAANEAAWLAKTDISGLEQRMSAVEGVADAAQTAQEVSDAIDAKITALDLDNSYDAKDSAANALTEAKGYTDDKIDDLIKTYIDGDVDSVINTLEEVAAWINNDTAGVTKIIEDVATNAANIKTINESAVMTSGITAAKVGEYDAVKSTVDTNKSTWDSVTNKLDTSVYNTFVGSTYATLDAAVAAANSHADSKDADIAKGVAAKQVTDTLGNLATKNEADLGLKALAHKDTVATADINDGAVTTNKLDTAVAGHINDGVSAKATIDLNKTTWDKAGTAVQPEAIADMATKTEVKALADGAVKQAQDEVDALEEVVAQNAQTCQNNFNTIVNQLTWGSF